MANNLRSVFRPLQIHLLILVLVLRPFLLEAANPLHHFCGSTGNFTVNSTYDENLSSLLSSISSDNSVSYGFYNLSSGQSPDQVNGIALCRGDVALSDCRACIKNSSLEIIRRCPVQKEAIIYYDNCLLRYSDQSIFRVVASRYMYYKWNLKNATSMTEFNQVLRELMDGLRSRAAAGSSIMKFAVGNMSAPDFQILYGLAQCTPDLSELQCNDCLVGAISRIPQCCEGKIGGRVIGPSCNIRFEVYRFYDPSAEAQAVPPAGSPPESPPNLKTDATVPPPPGKSSSTTRTIIIVVASITAVCLLVVSVFCICRRKLTKRIENDEAEDEIRTAESMQYDFEMVRAATNNFSDENKLGQGGFGTVYKGMLASGQEIAVKRLSRGLGQGDQEFKTEVLLVARLRHRNLVRLLGFCLSGDERLLIYEFLPNSSLDRFIFNLVKRQQLDWERRQKIIGGIARGLLYLHEDSQLRIIHRDLKASNVLLDAEMTPKISDFGMARLFVVDQTQAATSRIVGTYGYMAPEYALYGQFSVKSDVFSFGILVLEIVSGQKNNCFRSGETVQHLLSFAWRNWSEGTVSNIIDPSLINNGSRTEIQRCIHIGLLCVQENAANRPSMASVVLMLNSFSISLPVPSQPAFYMHSNMESTGSFLAMDNSRGTGSDESKSKSYRGSVDEDPITDLLPR